MGNLEVRLDAELLDIRLLRPLEERDQAPTRLQQIEGARVNIAAYGVQYGVNFTDRVFEALSLIIDDLIGAKTLRVRHVVGAHRSDDLRAQVLGQLNCNAAHATRAAVNEYSLTFR